MRSITVKEGQCMLDIAMQYLGDSSRCFEISELNGLLVTSYLQVGSSLLVPDVAVDKEFVVDEYVEGDLIPASTDENVLVDEGIGFWYVEEDFVVS